MNSLVETGLAHVQAPYSLQQLVEALSAALPSHCVLFREEDTRPYECDGLSLYRALPAVVALPETEEQVQSVMRICKRLNAPLVARGAGTGLSGGAMPHSQGVLLGLSKFNRIKHIDLASATAVVEPGVRNLPFPKPRRLTGCTTRRTLPARLPVPSAATSRKTLAACIA